MTGNARPKVVVLGMMSKIPVAGVVWQTLHYLVGFERLGLDAYYVEAHARTPSMLMTSEHDDAGALAADFIGAIMARHGLGDRWAFHALHSDARCYGMSASALGRLYREAAFILNLSGGTLPLPEHVATGRLVYLETDPVQPQIEVFDRLPETLDFLDQHCAHFTFAENYGKPACTLPRTSRYEFRPTRQPVVLDWWEGGAAPVGGRFTTVANWHQQWRAVSHDGRVYGWTKDDEFRRVIDLPAATSVGLELALANCDSADEATLVEHGWRVCSAGALSRDIDTYRGYIRGSRGEFSVAKEQNVAFRTGWFSDRSATYLAAGRPVIMQDTGFGETLPTGCGLLAFSTPDEAAAALEIMHGDYTRHAAGARELAHSHFSHEVVLGPLLDVLDVHGRSGHGRGTTRRLGRGPSDDDHRLPADLVVAPVSKRPMRLDPATLDVLRGRRRAGIFVARGPAVRESVDECPAVSIVVPVHDRVELTQLCLESMLEQPNDGSETVDYEIIVVDDASTDETAAYLSALALERPELRVVTNEECRGFARSVNRGLVETRGAVLVVANNDIIVTHGWMAGLVDHLDDPAVGLVSASTAAHSRNCRVEGQYRTYDDLQRVAVERRADLTRERAVTMAPLFCAALRREVLDQIGLLDEQFDVAMFEDDDYCARLEVAGYALVCALDVFVHHYGEGTLGELYADGAFHEVFVTNRARFERKWNRVWDPSEDVDDVTYVAQVRAIRAMLVDEVPVGEVVAVVSRGDDELVTLDGREGRHLPCTETGAYLGAHPTDGCDAIAQLDAARDAGARWLFVPDSSRWWLEHYDMLAAHLEIVGDLARDDELGRLYRVDPIDALEAASDAATRAPTASACTIISRNYLGQARVLADSYFVHHPDGRFYLLILDRLPAGVDLDPRILLVDPAELPLDDLYDMCFKYDVIELATAVKPALLILLTEDYGEERVMYIDPDMLIARPMTEVFEALKHADIVLTPHLNAPIPDDGLAPREQDILISGAYNLGFLGLRKSAESARLLGWWREHLNDRCRVDPANGLMVDQRWIDLVPSLFPSAYILRDDTYNVAYWNLHARSIQRAGDGFTCNGRPLALFHFSGYNPERPGMISKHQTRTELVAGSALAELFDTYGRAMLDAGFLESKAWSYGLAEFDNGIGLHAIFRRLYHELGDDRRRFGDPFAAGGDDSFYAWATTTDPARRNLSPFLEMAYRLRYDLQSAFPDVGGDDRAGFLAWAAGQGATEFGFAPELVHRCGPAPHPSRHETPAVDPPSDERVGSTVVPDAAPSVALPGVNVCGYLRNESGLGAAARTYISILEHLGVPLALRDISELSVNRSEDTSIDAFHDDHAHPVNLVCVNADQHFVVMAKDPDFFAGKYNIGVWFWELPSFPDKWRDRFAHYDEIWVGSSYIANTIAPLSPVPVVRIPPVLGSEAAGDRGRGRGALGVDDEFVFLFMFDFNSYIERKNPIAVIEAFRIAFPGRERARLVIKSVNGAFNTAGLAALAAATRADDRVTLLGEYVSAGEIADLTYACDCYVSLHRAEGTGLTMAHAMAAAKPVIATGWSGNTDFMDASNSLLVRFDLVELDRDIGPYKLGGTWADPDVEHAAALMRHVFDHPDEAAALGAAAQHAIATRFSSERLGHIAAERLRVIGERLRAAGPRPPVSREHGGNAALMGAIRHIVAREVNDGRPVIVVSKGDPVLVDLGAQPAWHYPQDDDGVYAGYYPADSATAVAHLERLRGRGAGHFLVPATCGWWLRHYRELRDHLDATYSLVAEDASCVLYRLDPVGPADPIGRDSSVDPSRIDDLGAQIDHVRATLAATGEWIADLAPRVVATDERAAAIPAVMREAFSTVSGAVAALEGDMDGRIEGIERGQQRLAGNLAAICSKLDEFAAHVEASRQVADVRHRQLDGRVAELAQRSGREAGELGGTLAELVARVGAVEQQRAVGSRLEPRSLDAGPPTAEVRASGGAGDLVRVAAPSSETATRALSADVANAARHPEARPYMSSDRFSTSDPDRPMGFSRTDGHEGERAELPTFADVFRGEPEFIAERQRIYLPFFGDGEQVVDLGSGRGEFLGLLAEAGIAAVGVEQDGSLVRACRRRGLVVHEQDALAFLHEVESASLDGIFSAQFIEHIDPARLGDLLVLARRALRAGGTFIAETVNPENPDALKTFHVDLTHQRPIFPQVLLHLCWEAGFDAAWIFYPLGGGFSQRAYDAVGEYAVVAKA
jgi:GT2 family glycosyltransferase/glycosyltransferase involved in cell wall biosynthesis